MQRIDLTTVILTALCVSVLPAQDKAPIPFKTRPALVEPVPSVPKTMHFCAAHCTTLIWDKDHFTNASDPGGSVWTVESFTRQSAVIRRTDTRPRPYAAVYRAGISAEGETIDGEGYSVLDPGSRAGVDLHLAILPDPQ